MGLWKVLPSLPEAFGMLRGSCGAFFEHHLGLKVGPRRSTFYRTLLASVEAGADTYLEMSNGTSSYGYDDLMARGCPARARELFRRAGQVGS